ncbi:MAG: ABC transporter permease [Eubacteriales bacterium]|nr:ABC transporter permease [Eubacteriales bacterium]
MMSKFLSSFLYRLKMILADRQLLVSMVVIPLVIAAIGGYALIKERDGEFVVYAVDEDESAFSEEFIGKLSRKEGLRVETGSLGKAAASVRQGRAEAIFIIPENFEGNIKQGKYDSSIKLVLSPYTFAFGFLQEISASIVMELSSRELSKEMVLESFRMLDLDFDQSTGEEVEEYFNSFVEPVPLMNIDYKTFGGKDEKADGPGLFPIGSVATGLIPVFSMFYIMSGSEWLLEERRNGTLKRLISCPGGLSIAYIGSAAALFGAGLIQIMLYISLTTLISGAFPIVNATAFTLLIIYLAAVVSLSMLLAAIFPTSNRLQSFAPFFVLATGFLGGCFWNFGEMPVSLKRLALFTPQGWLLEGFQRVQAASAGAFAVLQPFIVLIGMALLLYFLSYKIITVKTI